MLAAELAAVGPHDHPLRGRTMARLVGGLGLVGGAEAVGGADAVGPEEGDVHPEVGQGADGGVADRRLVMPRTRPPEDVQVIPGDADSRAAIGTELVAT